MWNRKELKTRAKEKFQRNYWKCVLVAMLFSIVMGGGYEGGMSFIGKFNGNDDSASIIHSGSWDEDEDSKSDGKENSFEDGENVTSDSDGNKEKIDIKVHPLFDDEDAAVQAAYESPLGEQVETSVDQIQMELDELDIDNIENFINDLKSLDETTKVALVVTAVLIISILALAAVIIGLGFEALLLNPLEIGCDRFFLKNLNEPANVSNTAYGFDHSYKNGVKIMLWRDVYLILWSMLLVIPGIIKMYEYKMIPYLLAEHPDMTKEEVFAESKRMMDGQKWNAFVLDLSFIGWELLSVLLTAGLLDIFFVHPYKRSAQAALYEALRYGKDVNEESESILA